MGIGEICFHLLEEIGEVAQEIFLVENLKNEEKAKSRTPYLESELADVFSWMMALVIKIQLHFRMMHEFEDKFAGRKPVRKQLEVTDIIWRAYYNKGKRKMACQHCGGRPCHCGDDALLKT